MRTTGSFRVWVKAQIAVACCSVMAATGLAATAPRPDILLIMPDQMRGDCLSILAHPAVRTPQLDELARQGALFRRAYSTVPSCIPARYALLTGLSPQNSGVVGFQAKPFSTVPLPELLSRAGYATVLVGRNMHQPAVSKLGYQKQILGSTYVEDDEYDTFLKQAAPETGGIKHLVGKTMKLSFNTSSAKPWPLADNLHPTTWVVSQSCKVVSEVAASQPLFLTASFYAPHPPLFPPKKYFDAYLQKKLPPPAHGDWVDWKALSPEGNKVGDRILLEGDALRDDQAGYFGLIEQLDAEIVKLIADFKARSAKAGRPWLIAVTSDHGEMLGDHGYFRKCEPYEGAANIPFIIAGSPELGFQPGLRCHQPVCLEDIMPTLLPLAGVARPAGIDGVNLVPTLRGENPVIREWLHSEHAPCYNPEQSFHALTDGHFKYIWRPTDGAEQLFDLQNDLKEEHDLSKNQASRATLEQWRTRLIQRLAARPEGFSDGHKLIPGRPYKALNAGIHPAAAAKLPSVLPAPQKMVVGAGVFKLTPDTRICTDAASRANGEFLAAQLRQATGYKFEVSSNPQPGGILLTTANAATSLGAEGYELIVAPDSVVIRALEPAGGFYGGQTLLQLLPPDALATQPVKGVNWTLPCVQIADAPRFEWRGLMLDCSRTFQSVAYLKQTIDRMAFYKMNVLHLHLTDDQGWRLEIKKYPELTAKGAFFPAKYNEPAAHQGFYTQEQMRDLVAYAAARHITIVPEIEMPGHSLAALSVLPHLSCTGGPFEIYPNMKGPGITPDIFCAGKEETFTFFSNVLAEVIEIFPSKYIHIGGDEAPKVRWKACPLCQKRIQDEGLKNEAELQSWFIRRAEKMVTAKGRRLIGWDEIAEGGLSPNAAVMWWRAKSGQSGTDIVKHALQNGHATVMSPNTHCYFDYSYQRTDTLRAYSFEPIPAGLDAAAVKLVLGVQANFWSHIDREPDRVDYQLFPRLLAIAERGWSPQETRDPDDFTRRVTAQLANLERLGVRYRAESSLGWLPAQMAEEFRPLEWDVTTLIRNAGNYEVKFAYKKGAHRLAIRSVELLASGKVVAADKHAGVTGAFNSKNTYTLNIPPSAPGAAYTLRAEVRSEGGTNSSGEIQIYGK